MQQSQFSAKNLVQISPPLSAMAVEKSLKMLRMETKLRLAGCTATNRKQLLLKFKQTNEIPNDQYS
ncbi:hypothetical protein [Methylomonas rosea]|uniref:Uncharacterized protein n=1 Tax=Methylomonas rosea TaxID=2952227 RepID=A0ABT1TXH9_9GAMM|nr:hypothetical protein [Methylomonas sp. WSC-7]MCQ8119479.1 hypothetical protein [Methylomonas sp. WSC-7]